uniref:thiamine diphosphokinase n=1 Tax=Ndongobacter massiliensis TaxID=1871025 RepID=UPI00093152F2|nr:thiamine diphosphokinase [Ndongobacter massiliensis]
MRVAIVAAGARMKDTTKLRRLLESVDGILCADGGWDTLEDLGIRPDVLLGDFDSMKKERTPQKLQSLCAERGITVHPFPTRKAETDAELALDYALQQGADEAILLQGIGNRWDHSLCNIFFLPSFAARGLRVCLVDDWNRIDYLGAGKHELSGVDPAWYVSFLACPEDVYLSLSGFDYNLDHVLVRNGSSLGVSNHLLAETGIIEVFGKGVYRILSCGH